MVEAVARRQHRSANPFGRGRPGIAYCKRGADRTRGPVFDQLYEHPTTLSPPWRPGAMPRSHPTLVVRTSASSCGRGRKRPAKRENCAMAGRKTCMAAVDPRPAYGRRLLAAHLETSFVISNIDTLPLPPNTAFSFSSALIRRRLIGVLQLVLLDVVPDLLGHFGARQRHAADDQRRASRTASSPS